MPGWASGTAYKAFSGMDLETCKQRCLADNACLSYSDSFAGTLKNCYLYKRPVRNEPVKPYPNFAMWDRNCGVTPTPTLIPTPISTSTPQCKVPGWASGTAYKSFSGMDLATCRQSCLADSACLSYSDSFAGRLNNCYLYKRPVKDEPVRPYNNFAMWDRDCPPPTPTPISTTHAQCKVPGWASGDGLQGLQWHEIRRLQETMSGGCLLPVV